MDDNELTRLAEEELMREAKRGEARVAVHGVMAWLRDKTPRTNKRFLSTTISNALQHNHRQRSVGNRVTDEDQVCESSAKLSSSKVAKQKEVLDLYLSSEKSDKELRRTHPYRVAPKLKRMSKDNLDDIDRTNYCDSKNKDRKLSKKTSCVK